MKETDWEGRDILAEESDEKVIFVWCMTPHPFDTEFDHLVERSWQQFIKLYEDGLERLLDHPTREELLNGGVTVNFKLVRMTLGEYREIIDATD